MTSATLPVYIINSAILPVYIMIEPFCQSLKYSSHKAISFNIKLVIVWYQFYPKKTVLSVLRDANVLVASP